MKKNILFAVRNMNIGGVEKSLISLLNSLNPDDYDIDVLLLENHGGFLEDIPSWVRVIYWSGYADIRDEVNLPPLVMIKRLFKSGKILSAFRLLVGFLSYKISKNIIHYYKAVFKGSGITGLKNHYDIAVSYTSIIAYLSYVVLNYVSAGQYYGWIHFDVNQLVIEKKSQYALHNRFDKIFVVSDSGRTEFCRLFPSLSNRCYVGYNILNKSEIIKQSNEIIDLPCSNEIITIVTVARLSYEKGVDLAINAASELKKEYSQFKWYIIGEGKEYSKLLSIIDNEKLCDHVFLLGKKNNPLPYVKCSDIYVQPSRTEGYCTTTNEAKVLGKPIITTDVNGMREQFVNKETAYIVPRENSHEIFKALYILCTNSDERIRLSTNIKKYGFVEDQKSVDSFFE